jgi:hypothetical protein
MAGQSTLDESAQDTNTFYRRTLHVLSDAAVPFLVGGSHAFLEYTGIVRNTKDFDLFLRRDDLDRAMDALEAAGYRTELTFPHWLGKAWQHEDFVDLVFSSGNGICRVDDGWFDNAVETQVLGMPVKIVPSEELLWQKAFVMERERFDGADIYHLLAAKGDRLDWNRLLARVGENWRVLLGHLVFFAFVYPRERARVPTWVMDELLGRMQRERAPEDIPVCNGTLLSREQYLIDVQERGYADARIPPYGSVPETEIKYWTDAIGKIK